MITLDAPDFHGFTVFCDEIRPEASGKMLHIGAYAGQHMIVHGAFPFLLPRLGIAVTYCQRKRVEIFPVKLCIFLPGDPEDKPSIETEIPSEPIHAGIEEKKKFHSFIPEEERGKFTNIHANLNFSSLQIKKPGFLKVRAARGEELVRLGALLITPAVDNSQPQPASIP
jgi:hypothetical protein